MAYENEKTEENQPFKDGEISIPFGEFLFLKGYFDKAFEIFEVLAQKGNGRAMYHLSEYYTWGYGSIKEDPEKAQQWRIRGQYNHNELATINICMSRKEKKEYCKDSLTKMLEQAKKNDVFAQKEFCNFLPRFETNLSRYRASGYASKYREVDFETDNLINIKLAESENEPFKFCTAAAEKGHILAQYTMGLYYYRTPSYYGPFAYKRDDSAFKLFLKAANGGLKDAQYETALAYYNGDGIKLNRSEAFLWYKQAAKQGHEIAQQMVAHWNNYNSVPAKFDSIAWHLELAKRGDVEEQYNTGIILSIGFYMATAFDWLKTAADNGLVDAQYEIAERYFYGIGVEQNQKEAFQRFMKIAKRKVISEDEFYALANYRPKATFMLGKCYEEGIGTAKNPKEAFKFYLETAQADFTETIAEILKDASYKTALFYFDGTGTNQDRNEAKLWYEKSAEYGHITAKKMLEHWDKYNALPDKYESLAWHKKLAEQGDAEAQNILGTIVEDQYRTNPKKNKKSATEAFQWYEKSAEQGNAKGQYNLARCYLEGFGIEKNEDNSFLWFTKSAEQGYPEALREIGNCYYSGISIMKNNAKAIEYYTKAAGIGDLKAQLLLADIYQEGKITEEDDEKSKLWYIKAAKTGNLEALSRNYLTLKETFQLLWDMIYQGKREAFEQLEQLYAQEKNHKDRLLALINLAKNIKDKQKLSHINKSITELRHEELMLKEGFKCYLKSAQEGASESQYMVGLSYFFGSGTSNNYNEAVKWFIKAQNQGNYNAKEMISYLQSLKKVGVTDFPKDIKEVCGELETWLGELAKQEDKDAEEALVVLRRLYRIEVDFYKDIKSHRCGRMP